MYIPLATMAEHKRELRSAKKASVEASPDLVLVFSSPPGGELDPKGALKDSLPLSDFILTDVLTTKGDLLGDNGTTPVRVPVGPDGSVLTANSSTSTGLSYTSLGPKGSILAAESTTLIGGFPVGTDGQVLTAESS